MLADTLEHPGGVPVHRGAAQRTHDGKVVVEPDVARRAEPFSRDRVNEPVCQLGPPPGPALPAQEHDDYRNILGPLVYGTQVNQSVSGLFCLRSSQGQDASHDLLGLLSRGGPKELLIRHSRGAECLDEGWQPVSRWLALAGLHQLDHVMQAGPDEGLEIPSRGRARGRGDGGGRSRSPYQRSLGSFAPDLLVRVLHVKRRADRFRIVGAGPDQRQDLPQARRALPGDLVLDR